MNTPSTLCQITKDFEAYCADMLQSGIELAAVSRSAHGSHVSTAMPETGLTAHFLLKVHQLRSNRIRVFIPPEQKTGGDLEVHVKLPGQRWIGMIIQAKRVSLTHGGTYRIPELSHRKGEQYKELMDFAKISHMLPLYMFYIPGDAISGIVNRSGVMICNADALHWEVGNREHDLQPIYPRLRKLSTIFCCLDGGREQEFVRKLEKIFYIKSLTYGSGHIGGYDPPAYVNDFINLGRIPSSWLRDNLSGAISIDLS